MNYSVGTRFGMTIEDEECAEKRCKSTLLTLRLSLLPLNSF